MFYRVYNFLIILYINLKMKNFTDYLTINQASKLLGVSTSTLRNWDVTSKLKAHRHPINGYRLYIKSDLENLLKDLNSKK